MLDGGNVDWGRAGIARLDDDVLNRANVRTVILMQGINNFILNSGTSRSCRTVHFR